MGVIELHLASKEGRDECSISSEKDGSLAYRTIVPRESIENLPTAVERFLPIWIDIVGPSGLVKECGKTSKNSFWLAKARVRAQAENRQLSTYVYPRTTNRWMSSFHSSVQSTRRYDNLYSVDMGLLEGEKRVICLKRLRVWSALHRRDWFCIALTCSCMINICHSLIMLF